MSRYNPNSVRNRARRRWNAYAAYQWSTYPGLRAFIQHAAHNPDSYGIQQPHHVDSVRDRCADGRDTK